MDMLGRSARRSSFVGWDDDAPRFDERRDANRCERLANFLVNLS